MGALRQAGQTFGADDHHRPIGLPADVFAVQCRRSTSLTAGDRGNRRVEPGQRLIVRISGGSMRAHRPAIGSPAVAPGHTPGRRNDRSAAGADR